MLIMNTLAQDVTVAYILLVIMARVIPRHVNYSSVPAVCYRHLCNSNNLFTNAPWLHSVNFGDAVPRPEVANSRRLSILQ